MNKDEIPAIKGIGRMGKMTNVAVITANIIRDFIPIKIPNPNLFPATAILKTTYLNIIQFAMPRAAPKRVLKNADVPLTTVVETIAITPHEVTQKSIFFR